MRKFACLPGLLALSALAACEPPLTAPDNPGVCWILADSVNGKQDFRPLSPGINSLENCAVRLETVRMAQTERPVTGAFQGVFIYVTDADVTTANGPKAQRYRLFTPAQRAKVQDAIRTMMEREKG